MQKYLIELYIILKSESEMVTHTKENLVLNPVSVEH